MRTLRSPGSQHCPFPSALAFPAGALQPLPSIQKHSSGRGEVVRGRFSGRPRPLSHSTIHSPAQTACVPSSQPDLSTCTSLRHCTSQPPPTPVPPATPDSRLLFFLGCPSEGWPHPPPHHPSLDLGININPSGLTRLFFKKSRQTYLSLSLHHCPGSGLRYFFPEPVGLSDSSLSSL